MGKARMDENGRILIPLVERQKLGLKARTMFDVAAEEGVLILRPIIPEPLGLDARRRKWGKEAFLGAGEATFGKL